MPINSRDRSILITVCMLRINPIYNEQAGTTSAFEKRKACLVAFIYTYTHTEKSNRIIGGCYLLKEEEFVKNEIFICTTWIKS